MIISFEESPPDAESRDTRGSESQLPSQIPRPPTTNPIYRSYKFFPFCLQYFLRLWYCLSGPLHVYNRLSFEERKKTDLLKLKNRNRKTKTSWIPLAEIKDESNWVAQCCSLFFMLCISSWATNNHLGGAGSALAWTIQCHPIVIVVSVVIVINDWY